MSLTTTCLEPLGLSVTEAAKALGVSRKTLSSLLEEGCQGPNSRWSGPAGATKASRR